MTQFGVGYGDAYNRRVQAAFEEDLDLTTYGRGHQQNGPATPHLLGAYNNKYRELIDLIDSLRSFGLERELQLPQVAVVGVQTSGKSSVLEGISGLQLPRGTGIVTRCPIELRLKYSGNEGGGWAGRITCENDKGERMDQQLRKPDDVTDQIIRAQQFLAGDHGISSRRIVVEVFSPYVPDLTLIDLPGLIEVAMDNQPKDIVEKVQAMVSEYIKMKETIIMVVIPCTMEIAITRALKMALEYDQDGNRTLGVLTKPDLVDKGAEEDIVNMVRTPDRFKIRKGFTVVKLRSKEDINNGMTMQAALKSENDWFQQNQHFRQLPKFVLGTKSLATKLTFELVDRIKTILPCLKADVHMKMKEVDEQLDELGRGIPEEEADRRQFLTDVLMKYTDKITRICEGIYDRHVPTEERLPFKIRPFMEDFAVTVAELMPDESNSYLRDRIDREIREQRGNELPGFFTYMACKNTIQKLLDHYMGPARDCLHKINSVVEEFLHKITEESFSAFPALMTQVKGVVGGIQQDQLDTCGKALTELFDIEALIVIPDILFYRGNARAQKAAAPERDPDTYTLCGFEDGVIPPGYEQPAVPDNKQKRGFLGRRKGRSSTPEPSAWPAGIAQGGGAPPPDFAKADTTSVGSQGPYIPAAETETGRNADYTLDKIVVYFRTALERLMGSIPARIHFHLVHTLSKEIKRRVTNMGSDAETIENLVEDEKTASIRADLLNRQECLQRSLEELNKF